MKHTEKENNSSITQSFVCSGLDNKRIGYNGFISLIIMIAKVNLKNKKLGVQSKIEIKLPIRWLA